MEQNALRKNMWEKAGKVGLVLGLISTTYMFISQWSSSAQISSALMMILNMVLWAGKFGGCIWIMMMAMKKFAAQDSKIENNTVFRFGVAVALLSALVFAAASFANAAFISADLINEQMTAAMEQMAPMMDSNTANMMETIIDKMPQITFFTNLFYSFIYGTILSFILSRNIPNKNPFSERTSDEW